MKLGGHRPPIGTPIPAPATPLCRASPRYAFYIFPEINRDALHRSPQSHRAQFHKPFITLNTANGSEGRATPLRARAITSTLCRKIFDALHLSQMYLQIPQWKANASLIFNHAAGSSAITNALDQWRSWTALLQCQLWRI